MQPKSIENYLQETGRAGRDGLPATCYLLFNKDDAIQQHSLAHTNKLAPAQLIVIFLEIFRRVPKMNSLASIDQIGRLPGRNYMDNAASQRFSFRQILCISFESFEKKTDCSSAVLETMLSILELAPFSLVTVEGIHMDKISGKFRKSEQAINTLAVDDPILRAILTLSEINHATNDTPGNDEEDEDEVGMLFLPKGRSIQNGNERSFECSRLSLATLLSIQVTEVTSKLFALQEKGVIQYSLSDSAVYLTINSPTEPNDSGISSILDCVDDNERYFSWICRQSQLLFDVVEKLDSAASRRIENMWKVGCTMASFTAADYNGGAASQPAAVDDDGKAGLQFELQTFLANMMEDDGVKSLTRDDDSYLANMVRHYDTTDNPFKIIAEERASKKEEEEAGVVAVASAEEKSSSAEQKQRQKYVDSLLLSIAAIRQDPMILYAVQTIVNSLGKSFLSFTAQFEPSSSVSSAPSIDTPAAFTAKSLHGGLLSLYVARVLHGLPSKLVSAAAWRGSFLADCWGKCKAVRFDDLLSFVRREVVFKMQS